MFFDQIFAPQLQPQITSPEPPKGIRGLVDDVYLITTSQKSSEYTGRLARTIEELRLAGLGPDDVKIRYFVPDDEDRVRGCYTSHIAVLREIQADMARSKPKSLQKNYRVLVLEDNLEMTARMGGPEGDGLSNAIDSTRAFFEGKAGYGDWDVLHMAYMAYVPDLSMERLQPEAGGADSVVQMRSGQGSAVGTSAYVISRSGVTRMLDFDRENGYCEAVPNVMARLFPDSRFATYPMVFHRAAKVGSLVNPQLDNFRQIMFSPALYTAWERYVVSTGWKTNQCFQVALGSFVLSILTAVGSAVWTATHASSVSAEQSVALGGLQLVAAFPLLVAVWGATLFNPQGRGAGYAVTSGAPSSLQNNPDAEGQR
jgi:hypothetical protein